jgi:hypothetical protein
MFPKLISDRYLEVLTQSPLGKLFVLKILKSKPPSVELGRWVELIFGLHEREIIQFKVVRPFLIPGAFKPVPAVRIYGLGPKRRVYPGNRLFVRFDERYPNVIDLEATVGDNEARIFQLQEKEWLKISPYLQAIVRSDIYRYKQMLAKEQRLAAL